MDATHTQVRSADLFYQTSFSCIRSRTNDSGQLAMFAAQHRCMAFKIDVSHTKLIFAILKFELI